MFLSLAPWLPAVIFYPSLILVVPKPDYLQAAPAGVDTAIDIGSCFLLGASEKAFFYHGAVTE